MQKVLENSRRRTLTLSAKPSHSEVLDPAYLDPSALREAHKLEELYGVPPLVDDRKPETLDPQRFGNRFRAHRRLTGKLIAEIAAERYGEILKSYVGIEGVVDQRRQLQTAWHQGERLYRESQKEFLQEIRLRKEGLVPQKRIGFGLTYEVVDYSPHPDVIWGLLRAARDLIGEERLRTMLQLGPASDDAAEVQYQERLKATGEAPKTQRPELYRLMWPSETFQGVEAALAEGDAERFARMAVSAFRQCFVQPNAKERVRTERWMREAVHRICQEQSIPVGEPVVGGATAFTALQASEAHAQNVAMISCSEDYSPQFVDLMPKDMTVVGRDGNATHGFEGRNIVPQPGHFSVTKSMTVPHDFDGYEICFNLKADKSKAEESQQLNKLTLKAGTSFVGAVLITGERMPLGWPDFTDDQWREFAKSLDTFLFTGLQSCETDSAVHHTMDGLERLAYADRENPVGIHFEYTEPRVAGKAVELTMFRRIRDSRAIDFMAINTSEAVGLLQRLGKIGEPNRNEVEREFSIGPAMQARIKETLKLLEIAGEAYPWGNEPCQNPAWMVESARLLSEIFEIPAVRVRGMHRDHTHFDRYYVDPSQNPDCLSRTQLRRFARVKTFSRHQSAAKVAKPEGRIPSVEAQPAYVYVGSPEVFACRLVHAAAVSRYATPAETERFRRTGCGKFRDGSVGVGADTHPFVIRDGGVQSAGDEQAMTVTSLGADELQTISRLQRQRPVPIVLNSWTPVPSNGYSNGNGGNGYANLPGETVVGLAPNGHHHDHRRIAMRPRVLRQ